MGSSNGIDLKLGPVVGLDKRYWEYKFTIHHKHAITNIQIKHNSNHDPKIINGIFKGLVNRALTLCSPEHLDEELEFLTNVFLENGYNKENLLHTIELSRSNIFRINRINREENRK